MLSKVLKAPKDLVIDLALEKEKNRYNEEVYLLYNPEGTSGVLSVGREIYDLIKAVDGKSSVKEIFKKLHIKEKDYITICNVITQLIENNILYVVGESNKIDTEKIFNKTLTCWLHLTNDCNLRCKYCYIHKSHSVMSDDILYPAIDKMMASCRRHGYKTLSLMLVGGEALTRFDTIKNIVDYCNKNKKDLNVTYTLPTNGTLITKDVAKFVVDNEFNVGVSLDGIGEYNNNRVYANGTSSYDKVITGIDNLIERNLKPSIMITVTNDNLDGLPDLTRDMIKRKIYFRFSLERDTTTGKPPILNDENHCIAVLKECFNIMIESLINGDDGWYFKFGDVSFGIPYTRACAAGKNFFAIGEDGSIGSCSLGLENTRGNIKDINDVIDDITNIFSDIGKTSACDVEECSNCTWRYSCAGACPLQTYASYKTLNHISPYCNIYKACLPYVVKIYAIAIYFKMKSKFSNS